jgi:hypothetical protein
MHLAVVCLVAWNVQFEAVCVLREGLRLAVESFVRRLTTTKRFLLIIALVVPYSFAVLLAAPSEFVQPSLTTKHFR